jgi:hypothetical protein
MQSDRVLRDKAAREEYKRGPSYTPSIIAGILRAYNLPPAPDLKSPRDEGDKFSLTAYPPQTIIATTFLDDLLKEWYLRQGKLVNRRVGYVFKMDNLPGEEPQYIGLIIQYSNPDAAFSRKYWLIPKNKLCDYLSPEKLKKFYGDIQVVIIGKISHLRAFTPKIKEALSRISRNKDVLASTHSDFLTMRSLAVQVTHDFITLLRAKDLCGFVRDRDELAKNSFKAKTYAREHLKNCQQVLLNAWQEYKNFPLYQDLQNELVETRKLLKASRIPTELQNDLHKMLEDLPLDVLTHLLNSDDAEKHPELLREYRSSLPKLLESKLIGLKGNCLSGEQIRVTNFDTSKIKSNSLDAFLAAAPKEAQDKINEKLNKGLKHGYSISQKNPINLLQFSQPVNEKELYNRLMRTGKSSKKKRQPTTKPPTTEEIDQPVDEKKLCIESEKMYNQIIRTEKSPEKKPQPTTEKKKKKKKKKQTTISKSSSSVNSKDEKKSEPEKPKPQHSPARQKFQRIQLQFQTLVKTADDNALMKLMSPLLEQCQEPELEMEMHDFMGDYYLRTADNIYRKDDVNHEVKRLLVRAWSHKERVQELINRFPETEFVQSRPFLDDLTNFVENYEVDSIRRKEKELEKVCRRLQELAANRAPARLRLGEERWRNNPNPKHEARGLLEKKAGLKDSIQSTNISYVDAKLELPSQTQILSKVVVDKESKHEVKQEYAIVLRFEERIAEGIEKFYHFLQSAIQDRMQVHKLTQAPDNFFPRKILTSVVKFMMIINCSVPYDVYKTYLLGGLIAWLFQKTGVGTQPFNFLDADMLTNVDSDTLIKIAGEQLLDYKITGEFEKFTAFKFYYEGINIDVISSKSQKLNMPGYRDQGDFNINTISLIEDRKKRDFNFNTISLEVKDFRIYLHDYNKIIPQLIDTQLLDVARPGLIKSCTGHLNNIPITQIIPQWKQLCQSIEQSGSRKLRKLDLLDLEHTLKNFIVDPIRLLRLVFMLTKGMIKFDNLDYALQLCFSFSKKNFLLAAVLEQYAIRSGSAFPFALIFDKYFNYAIKKAAQSLNCMRSMEESYRIQLLDVFSRMMQWGCRHKFFPQMFTFPLKMHAPHAYYEKIDSGFQRLFDQKSAQPPVYGLLRKNLIEMYIATDKPELSTRMLPLVLALIMTIEGTIPGAGDFSILLKNMIELIQTIPALQQLYWNFSTHQLPIASRQYLTTFAAAVKADQSLLKCKEKAQTGVSAYSDVSFLPPPTPTPGQPDLVVKPVETKTFDKRL